MSGPITVAFSFTPLGAVVLAAQAIREAQAMGQEYAEALENVREREAAHDEARRREREAQSARDAAIAAETGRLERRLERLRGIGAAVGEKAPQLAEALAVRTLQRPQGDHGMLTLYTEDMRQEIRRIEELLAQASAKLGERLQGARELPDLDQLLGLYALQRSLRPGLDPAQSARFRETVARILARLDLPEKSVIPEELDKLAAEILLAPSLERAEHLAAELRLGVQRFHDERAAQSRDAEEAVALLEGLPEPAPAALRAALEQVIAGIRRLDEPTRQAALDLRERIEREAAALVLEQSLRDLGYEVEGVENTLFVEGGVVHFQRQGWEDYFVRLRLDPAEKTLNFNVVRARGGEENEVRKRLDTLAEDRWCSEFPRLLKTLAARGVNLEVTRQLGAGELPVQAVDPASLPRQQAEEDRERSGKAPLQKGWPK